MGLTKLCYSFGRLDSLTYDHRKGLTMKGSEFVVAVLVVALVFAVNERYLGLF